jgi:hypothetical protein
MAGQWNNHAADPRQPTADHISAIAREIAGTDARQAGGAATLLLDILGALFPYVAVAVLAYPAWALWWQFSPTARELRERLPVPWGIPAQQPPAGGENSPRVDPKTSTGPQASGAAASADDDRRDSGALPGQGDTPPRDPAPQRLEPAVPPPPVPLTGRQTGKAGTAAVTGDREKMQSRSR